MKCCKISRRRKMMVAPRTDWFFVAIIVLKNILRNCESMYRCEVTSIVAWADVRVQLTAHLYCCLLILMCYYCLNHSINWSLHIDFVFLTVCVCFKCILRPYRVSYVRLKVRPRVQVQIRSTLNLLCQLSLSNFSQRIKSLITKLYLYDYECTNWAPWHWNRR